jgi:hypothetical protein
MLRALEYEVPAQVAEADQRVLEGLFRLPYVESGLPNYLIHSASPVALNEKNFCAM